MTYQVNFTQLRLSLERRARQNGHFLEYKLSEENMTLISTRSFGEITSFSGFMQGLLGRSSCSVVTL